MKNDYAGNPINAENYIIETFQQYPIIGLGEGGHHLENSHLFFKKLLNNPKIQDILNVIIVEFANTSYQNILDKYIFGEEVSIHELRKVWRESTQCINRFGEASMYLELLKHIREINFHLSNEKKIQVLGGDPPINWKAIHSLEDYQKCLSERDCFPAQLAINHAINKKKKVLMLYSEFHFTKIVESHDNITTYINYQCPGNIKIIAVLDPTAFHLENMSQNWPLYSIIDLDVNEIGNYPAENYFTQIFNKNGKVVLFKNNKIKDLFDAFLYIGPSQTWIRVGIPRSHFSKEEWGELNRRRTVIGLTPLDDI